MINSEVMIERGKDAIIDYLAREKNKYLNTSDVSVVWFCKTLKNWKMLAITNLFDSRYYEITYNGNTDEIYLDVYSKEDNGVY